MYDISEFIAPAPAPAPPSKKVCQTRAPVRLLGNKSDDIFSDSEDEMMDGADKDKEKDTSPEEERQGPFMRAGAGAGAATKPTVLKLTQQNPVESAHNLPRKTRSGVQFSDQNYSTPAKKDLDKRKKRKVTPFKPHIDDVVLSPY